MYPHIPKFILPVHSLLLDLQIQLRTDKCLSVSVKHSTCPAHSFLQTSPQLRLSCYWSWMSFLSSLWIFNTSEQGPTNWFCGKSETVISFLRSSESCCAFTRAFQSTLTSDTISWLHFLQVVNKLAYSQTRILTPTNFMQLITHVQNVFFNTYFYPLFFIVLLYLCSTITDSYLCTVSSY